MPSAARSAAAAWRDGRVAEGARLESVYTGNRIAGSNPAPSATCNSTEIRISPKNILAIGFSTSWSSNGGRRGVLKSEASGGG